MSKRGDAWERVKLIIALLSLTLYLYSCFCPAFEVVTNELYENRIIHGYACFLFGWLGLPCSIWNLVWCLNPIYLLSMISFLLRKGKRSQNIAMSMCGCTVVVGLSFYFCDHACVDESGSKYELGKLFIGYYLWVLSFLILLSDMLLLLIYNRDVTGHLCHKSKKI